jgi:hypothetical protein
LAHARAGRASRERVRRRGGGRPRRLLPSLRDRGDDLPLLVRHFVRRFSQEQGREV